MTLNYIWRSIQPRLSFSRPFQQSLACFRIARSPSNSWASCLHPFPSISTFQKLPVYFYLLALMSMSLQYTVPHSKQCVIWYKNAVQFSASFIVIVCQFLMLMSSLSTTSDPGGSWSPVLGCWLSRQIFTFQRSRSSSRSKLSYWQFSTRNSSVMI